MDQPLVPPEAIDSLVRARRAARLYQSEHQRVAALLSTTGLTVARTSVLEALSRRGDRGASVADLALDVGVHRTSVAAVVRQLCSLGLVVSGRDERDARRITLRITPEGSVLFARACALLTEV